MRAPLLILLVAWSAAPAAFAEEPRMGIIEATLNGERKTWHVGAAGDVPGATWVEQGPGRYSAIITGFERLGQTLSGSKLTVGFEFTHGERSIRQEIAEPDRSLAAVRLMPSVRDFETNHNVTQGHLRASRIELLDRGRYHLTGSFSGTLTDSTGEVVGELTDGRFEVEAAREVAVQ